MKRISRIELEPELDLSPMDAYIGKSCAEIDSELSLEINPAGKSYVRLIIEGMIEKLKIDIPSPKYEYKMIRVNQFGKAKNPSPYKVTNYHEIILEKWETSEFKKLLEPTYIFFVVTHGSPDTSIFKGYITHNFTKSEMQSAEYVWADTRDKIREGIYDRFLTEKETKTFFFKIHANSVSDRTSAPNSSQETIRSFWISKSLISEIISELY